MADDVVVRELAIDDLPASWDLGRLAFGSLAPTPTFELTPGVTRYGAFDGDGRLLGRVTDLHHGQWWGGRRLAAADIGGVAVIPEARGRGVSRSLLRHLLERARERGAAVSSLFPTVSAVYRSAGWTMAGALRTVDLPAAYLPRPPAQAGLTVRPGTPADSPAAAALYTEVARLRNGMLSRDGAGDEASADAFPEDVDGMTVVADGDRMVGFARWAHRSGYGLDSVLEVEEVLATTAAAARELVAVLAGWRTVAPTIRLRPLTSGAFTATLPSETAGMRQLALGHRSVPWMHRTVDLVAAVAERGWPAWRAGRTTFHLDDDLAPWNSGTWELEIAGGQGRLEPSRAATDVHLSIEGFGQLYTGVASSAIVAEAGLLAAGPDDDLSGLEALMASPAAEILDYF